MCRSWRPSGWTGMVKKFVNPRLAAYTDESATLRSLAIAGATARHVVDDMTGVNSTALTALPMYAHVAAKVVELERVSPLIGAYSVSSSKPLL